MSISESSPPPTASPYASLEAYVALPRLEGLALSPDGQRVVVGVATLKQDRTGYDRSLWEIGVAGDTEPRQVTRSVAGESAPAFTGDGELLFVSARTGGGGPEQDGTPLPQLWALPSSGEARALTALASGVEGIGAVARAGRTTVLETRLLPSAATLEEDATLRAEREESKVGAILHEQYPVRYWDHDLGPGEQHLLAIEVTSPPTQPSAPEPDARGADSRASAAAGGPAADYPPHLERPTDLTPHPALRRGSGGGSMALTPDGSTLVVSLLRPQGFRERQALVAIDTATGAHTALVDEPSVRAESPTLSNDGRTVAYLRSTFSTPDAPADQELWLRELGDTAGMTHRRVGGGWDRWPSEFQFDHDDRSLIVVADDHGRGPLFRVPLDDGEVEQITHDDFAYSHVKVGPDGTLVAVRSNWQLPPHPVRIDRDGTVSPLPTPAPVPTPAAQMVEVETPTGDGVEVRGWLLTPPDASPSAPAPLLLWIHGGPLSSWNAWSWRWSAQLAVARGYAVLLPDPALSTGYGLDFIARGWNAWGRAPYRDLMAITDAVAARPEIDATRTAAMGGSFGGYMANWIAGHTDRFRAIVTHASLWALDQFRDTTDGAPYWDEMFDDAQLLANSPHLFVDRISTPMLVVHGDRDYRVPIGEGNRLWTDLARRFAGPDGSLPHRYLYFPDENHWVLRPQNATIWYETVFAFLAEHVRGEPWRRPRLLG